MVGGGDEGEKRVEGVEDVGPRDADGDRKLNVVLWSSSNAHGPVVKLAGTVLTLPRDQPIKPTYASLKENPKRQKRTVESSTRRRLNGKAIRHLLAVNLNVRGHAAVFVQKTQLAVLALNRTCRERHIANRSKIPDKEKLIFHQECLPIVRGSNSNNNNNKHEQQQRR